MEKVGTSAGKFFSVRAPVRLGGKKYIPSVCYPVTPDIVGTVDALVGNGKAVVYAERVRFLSGRVVDEAAFMRVEPTITMPDAAVSVVKSVENPASVAEEDGAGEFAGAM